jgi:hypothetical protein
LDSWIRRLNRQIIKLELDKKVGEPKETLKGLVKRRWVLGDRRQLLNEGSRGRV